MRQWRCIGFFLLALVLWSCHLRGQQWQEASIVGVPIDNAKAPTVIFVRSDMPVTVPNQPLPLDTWITIDLAPGTPWGGSLGIPADTKAVFLSGILVLTYTSTTNLGACNVTANFRAPGSSLDGLDYQMQTLEATVGGGSRSNAAVVVPIKGLKFEFYWHVSGPCPALINLSLQEYVR